MSFLSEILELVIMRKPRSQKTVSIFEVFEILKLTEKSKVTLSLTYLIFVIFFTRAKFLENKIYTEKRQFCALDLYKTPLFRVKSVENANFSR